MKNGTIVRAILLFCLVTVIAAFQGNAQQTRQDGWQLLAQRKVNFVRDKDEITVRSTATFTAIRFAVEDKAIGISEVKIHFVNGDKLEPSVDEIIKAGDQSSVIELGNEGKQVTKIKFKYRTIGSILKGRSNVSVYGRTTANSVQ